MDIRFPRIVPRITDELWFPDPNTDDKEHSRLLLFEDALTFAINELKK